MIAYQQHQSSGIEWPPPDSMMLSQIVQVPPTLPKSTQPAAIFDDLEKQMLAFAADHDATLEEVRKYFVLPNDSSVATVLSAHRGLVRILLEAVAPLRACFGAEYIFNLRAPIDDSGSRTLYAVAMWPGTVRDARSALAKFDDDWWIAQSRQAAGYLTFTYELV
jgi:hypothetical protein